MRYILAVIAALIGSAAFAEGAFAEGTGRLDAALESPEMDRWLVNPQDAVDVIIDIGFSYGAANALTSQAITVAVAHGHAGARARAMADLLKADLDDDLSVSREEIDAIDMELSGYARGLLWTRHRHADQDADGLVTFDELRAYALTRADKFLSHGRIEMLEALLLLDLDADGAVTVEEAEAAMKELTELSEARVSFEEDV